MLDLSVFYDILFIMKYYNAKRAAEILGYHPEYLRELAKQGKIDFSRTPGGHRKYNVEGFIKNESEPTPFTTACYCRVSSVKQKDDLERQVNFLRDIYRDAEVIRDIGVDPILKRKQTVAQTLMMSFLLVFTTYFCLFAVSKAAGAEVEDIIKHIDQLYRSKTSHADIEMQIVTPHYERTLKMLVWTKDMDKTFIRITAPKKDKDVATLRIGNQMWNYLPKINKVMKFPPSMMMDSWMGSDFTNDDLVKESSLLNDYTYRMITPEDATPDHLYVELIPNEESPIVWGKVIAAVRSTDYIPVWQHFYDEKGKLMRVLNFKEIKKFGSKTLPSVMEMIPQNKEGHKTVVRFLKAEYDSDIDEKIFTRRNLQKRK